ncbi:uncharacterized protein SPPG_01730 [Spizellomyces punctatus DAOM BR117]|uniref:DNA helicase n=1 Tax=Spizellomyces punctatus (strain DAOM BR117) TaxID=645134 RepID=A0A0L0HNJ1_SPIPD|nr:hypothetical protein, variant [Spizellomyces punctatus DAOM BR117]XP_016610682.1 uncharacterized protein SPPG_01730 [Spizellomyces punctatus DAOM BR117]KND02642.1 hypothetical protein, variant [Spizellomyces punctatus DAOM BR117]KND02643.1 hypothetical protein SPPG_01730 [Spizellomyces punctatus DAOM BR117]|eukprot:XP_016610681.1 hypothetical protein, variant [Spizellomyces punctatus DAOM BR117]
MKRTDSSDTDVDSSSSLPKRRRLLRKNGNGGEKRRDDQEDWFEKTDTFSSPSKPQTVDRTPKNQRSSEILSDTVIPETPVPARPGSIPKDTRSAVDLSSDVDMPVTDWVSPVKRYQNPPARSPTPVLDKPDAEFKAKPRYGARKVKPVEAISDATNTMDQSFGNIVKSFKYEPSISNGGHRPPSIATRAVPSQSTPLLKEAKSDHTSKLSRTHGTDELPSMGDALKSHQIRNNWHPWVAEARNLSVENDSPLTRRPAEPVPNTGTSQDAKLAKLIDTFPDSDPAALQRVLERASNDVEVAAELLMKGRDSSPASLSNDGTEGPRRRRLVKRKDVKELTPQSSDVEVVAIKRPPPPKQKPVRIRDEDTESDEATDVDEGPNGGYAKSIDLDAQTVAFFNTASLQQLMEAIMCTTEQGDFVIGLRPFVDMAHLRDSLAGHKNHRLLAKLPDKYQDVLEGYGQVDMLIERCEKFGEEVMSVLKRWTKEESQGGEEIGEKIEEDGDAPEICLTHVDESVQGDEDDMEVDGRTLFKCLRVQPALVNPELTLKSYQLVGISWLYMLHSKGLGGIFADEMGLGKTAQVISFLGYLKSHGKSGPHLVVVPSSTLENWLREFAKWVPSLRVRSYYGSQKDRYEMQESIYNEIDDIDVLVTTYNLATGQRDDRGFLRKLRCKSLILDEGHMVKNMESARYKHLMSYKTPFRLLLTGTPLQNNLMELLALLTFIMPDLFANFEAFNKIFNVKQSAAQGESGFLSRQRIERAKKIMAPFVLRRKKAQVLKELPSKHVRIETCTATEGQRELYQSIIAESRKSLLENGETAQTSSTNGVKKGKQAPRTPNARPPTGEKKQLSNVLMQLRKAADHPLLFRRHYTDTKLWTMSREIMKEVEYMDADRNYIYEDMQIMSDFELHQLCMKNKSIYKHRLQSKHWMDAGKVKRLEVMLLEMREKGDRILVFSQFVMMLDILEAVLDSMGIRFLRMDGRTTVTERQSMIDEFNDNDEVTVFLLSTKAGGFGINLTSANVVFLYDLDFNPHNDAQAEDRAHRVGQTRDVTVIKMVLDGSVEQHILRLAEAKLKLDAKVQQREEEDTAEMDEESSNGKKKPAKRKKKTGKGDDEDADERESEDSEPPIDNGFLNILRSELVGKCNST